MRNFFSRLPVLLAAACLSISLIGCGGRVPSDSGASYQAVILSPTQNAFYVFDLLTNRVRYTIPTGMVPQDVVIGQGGLVFVSHAQENSVAIFQRADPWIWNSIGKVGGTDQPGRLIYGDRSQELYVAAANAPRLAVYRINGLRRPLQQQVLRLDEGISKPTAIALAADGQTVYVAGGAVLQSLTRGNEKLSPGQTLALPEKSEIVDMLVADKNLLLVDRAQDQVLVVDAATLKQTGTVSLAQGEEPILPERMALNHAGTKVYLTGSGASVVQVLDAKNPKLLQTLRLDDAALKNPAGEPFGIDVLGNDREVYVTARSGRNLAILDANPAVDQNDKIQRTLGTGVHEAWLRPLGAMKIF